MARHLAWSLQAEALRQKIGDETLLRSFFTLIEDDGARPEFIDHLTASAARRARGPLVVDDSDCLDLKLGATFGNRGKNRCTFGAVGHSVRRVLDVAADEDFALRCKNGRADPELGKWRVRVPRYFARGSKQAFARRNRHFICWHTQIDWAEDREIVTPVCLRRRYFDARLKS